MISKALVKEISEARWFHIHDAPYLIVDTDLRIVAVNTAYELATDRPRGDLLGELLFEAFPDNPAVPDAAGVGSLSASLESVFRDAKRHYMGVQRYDVPDRRNPGQFTYKEWAPVDSPISERGRVVGAVHHVDDVTPVFDPARAGLDRKVLHEAAHAIWGQSPGLPYQAVGGVLAHSHRLILEATGAVIPDRAEELATLRLELIAGHPR